MFFICLRNALHIQERTTILSLVGKFERLFKSLETERSLLHYMHGIKGGGVQFQGAAPWRISA